MLRANQQVVNHNANITLVGIRKAEIDYFTAFFNNFGTQCFLLAAVIAGNISQTPQDYDTANTPYFWQFAYNFSSSSCLALCCMVLLGTVFIAVLGQGLAIRGTAGSMVQTIQGMVAEQQLVVMMFVGVAVSYQVQFFCTFFVVMSWQWATICTILVILIAYYTYYSTMRIYNRFKWIPEDSADWGQDFHGEQRPQVSHGKSVQVDKAKVTSVRFLDFFLKEKDSTKSEQPTAENSEAPYTVMVDDIIPPVKNATNNAGYLTVKALPQNKRKQLKMQLGFRDEVWMRCYFVLSSRQLYYYSDKRSYEIDPLHPINHRPIVLLGYSLVAESTEAPYKFSLVPTEPDDIRKSWRFRCDTIHEYEFWISLLQKELSSF